MANGNQARTAERLKKATADLGGNQLDRLEFQLGWLCGEIDKVRQENAEMRRELAELRNAINRGLPWDGEK